MSELKIFAQKAFLDHFFQQKPVGDIEEEEDKVMAWLEAKRLLGRSEIELDLDLDTLKSLLSENLPLLSLHKTGACKLVPNSEFFRKALEDSAEYAQAPSRVVFMLDRKAEDCRQLKTEHGLFFLGTEMEIQEFQSLVEHIEPLVIKKGNVNPGPKQNWSFLKKVSYPSNALIIQDNYLFSGFYECNLPHILDNLLPAQLSRSDFHLTIIASEKSGVDLEKKYADLLKIIQDLSRPYTIRSQIFTTNKLHDRELITNYLWINSGFGFNIFNYKGQGRQTTLSFYPIGRTPGKKLDTALAESSSEILQIFRKIVDEMPQNGMMGSTPVAVGDLSFRNRLLEDGVVRK
ncbi:MAG: hypothetical protein IPL49_22105 [Saprospirales bacterium]|nr:hypothetical protein [Saprospirales bacterium]